MKIIKDLFIGGVTICIIVYLAVSCIEGKRDLPKDELQLHGYVPDEETAIRIAEAIWLPIYGKEIDSEKSFHAVLKGDSVWIVEGTLERGAVGGTAYAEIRKRDCKVLKITHYK